VLSVLLVMVVARIAFNTAWLLPGKALHYGVAFVAGPVEFFCIAFISVFLYPILYRMGTAPLERLIVCLLCPALWVLIESYNIGQAFNLLETLYFAVNIGFILFCWHCTVMALWEMALRCRARNRGNADNIKIITPLLLLPPLLMTGIGAMLSVEGGAWYFHNILSGGYALLFAR
jgi:hypothetical protein